MVRVRFNDTNDVAESHRWLFERMDKDPNDLSKEYAWTHFDVIRIENGLIKEHWDEAVIAPATPAR